MNVNIFNKIVEERMDVIKDILINKAKEYADDTERFANFKASAAMNETTTQQEAWNFLSKHIISVRDMCKSTKPITQEMIDEKCGDFIVYGFLLEGILLEVLWQEQKERVQQQEHSKYSGNRATSAKLSKDLSDTPTLERTILAASTSTLCGKDVKE